MIGMQQTQQGFVLPAALRKTLDFFSEFAGCFRRALIAQDAYTTLSGMSDDELAAHGMTRDDLPQEMLRIMEGR